MPETQQPNESARRPKPSIFSRDPPFWLLPLLTALVFALILLIPTRPRTPDDGPVVRRALDSGSAYCTVRMAGRDKTFSLWCTRWHPTCIENMLKA
jgi:hypothetical protein